MPREINAVHPSSSMHMGIALAMSAQIGCKVGGCPRRLTVMSDIVLPNNIGVEVGYYTAETRRPELV
jgi:hypothetical protein